MQNSADKNQKVDDDDGHYIVKPDTNLTDRCKPRLLLVSLMVQDCLLGFGC